MALDVKMVRGGLLVRVVKRGDNIMDEEYIGKTGRITAFDPDECGASETDPMVVVRFPGGKEDGFWLEELDACTQVQKSRPHTRSKSRAKQDDLTRRRRLNNGQCPTHGTGLTQSGVSIDAEGNPTGEVVSCPRADCDFWTEVKPNTKLELALRGSPKKDTAT